MKKDKKVLFRLINFVILIVFIVIAAIFVQLTMNISITSLITGKRVSTVTKFEGDVSAVSAGTGKSIRAFNNMKLKQGDKLQTGKNSWAEIKVDEDKTVLVSENSSLDISELSGKGKSTVTLLMLEAGKVWTNINEKLNDDARYEIRTPTATMGVRGTRFYVESQETGTKVAVLEGTVAASVKILDKGADNKNLPKEVTLLIEKDRQLSLLKDQVTTEDDLKKMIVKVDLTSMDPIILKYIKDNPGNVEPESLKEIDEIIVYKKAEAELRNSGKIQLNGVVLLPDGKRNTGGGHIHIRDKDNKWVYYGILNENGEFIAGELPDGTYWLRADPAMNSSYARSNETQFVLSGGKANPAEIKINFNTIQISAEVVNPDGTPVAAGNVHISDSNGNWVYYTELEGRRNVTNSGGLPNGSYGIIAYPAGKSDFVQSDLVSFSIGGGKASPELAKLKLNIPQLSGKVTNGANTTSGHVHVRDDKNKYVQYVLLENNGEFRIGGLKDGTYWIMADSSESAGGKSSDQLEIRIAGGKAVKSSVELTFK